MSLSLPRGGALKRLYAQPGALANPGPYGPKIIFQYVAPNGSKYRVEALSREAAVSSVWTNHMMKE